MSDASRKQSVDLAPAELADEWRRNPGLKLLDIREEFERQMANIDGAIHVTEALSQEILSSWPKDTPIVVHCHHGVRSLEAVRYLISQGFTDVRNLAGGIDAWSLQVDASVPRY